jgi:hypothetical protein
VSGIITSKFGFKFPKSWISLPENPAAGPLTTDPDTGRSSGLVALWNTCHTGYAEKGECVTAPVEMDYSEFNDNSGGHVYVYEDDNPDKISKLGVGVITALGGHEPGRRITSSREMNRAMSEDLAVQAMVGRVYPTKDGIYFAGAAWPGTSAEVIARGIAGRPSGDWRSTLITRGKKLLGIHLVNKPGYKTGERLVASEFEEHPAGILLPIDGGMIFDVEEEEMAKSGERLVASGEGGCQCQVSEDPVAAVSQAPKSEVQASVVVEKMADDGTVILRSPDGIEYRGTVEKYVEPKPLTVVGLKKMQDYEKKVFED